MGINKRPQGGVLSDMTGVKHPQAQITIDVVIPVLNEGVKSWTNVL